MNQPPPGIKTFTVVLRENIPDDYSMISQTGIIDQLSGKTLIVWKVPEKEAGTYLSLKNWRVAGDSAMFNIKCFVEMF